MLLFAGYLWGLLPTKQMSISAIARLSERECMRVAFVDACWWALLHWQLIGAFAGRLSCYDSSVNKALSSSVNLKKYATASSKGGL